MPVMNNELRELLISLKESDHELREAILKDGSLYDGYDEEMEALHIRNAEQLEKIVAEYGWPGKSLVGKDGSDAAVIIAQHSISKPVLQRIFLEYLKSALVAGEALPVQEACLEDRILFNAGKPQKYGMLFDWNEKGELYTNVDNVTLANKRRKRLGLKSIEEATKLHSQEIEKEGGGPPSDFHEHKRKEAAWAKRVGWR
jgi:hypothetical protein